jgi:prefoldin alpha subunit
MSELHSDSFERLIVEQTSYIDDIDQRINKWTQFQSDYQHLQQRLSTLPDRLTYECMIPFGKLAFMPGRIVHSNEILVLLGDNYFVERTCKQANDIVQRRLININDKLEKYGQEKNVFEQQKTYTNEFLDDRTKFIEIKEDDDQFHTTTRRNRRAQLTDEQIRDERRQLQARALKLSQDTCRQQVQFDDNQMEIDSDDDNDVPREQLRKITIEHTPMEQPLIGDPSPALYSHPGMIGQSNVKAFTGQMIERAVPITSEPSKRISKFKASRS